MLDNGCNALRVSLKKGKVLSAQKSLQGIYCLSYNIHEENSWVAAAGKDSPERAIWAYPEKKIWLIGRKVKIATATSGVYARRKSGASPYSKGITWNYQSKGWKKDDSNDIKVKCMDKGPR